MCVCVCVCVCACAHACVRVCVCVCVQREVAALLIFSLFTLNVHQSVTIHRFEDDEKQTVCVSARDLNLFENTKLIERCCCCCCCLVSVDEGTARHANDTNDKCT